MFLKKITAAGVSVPLLTQLAACTVRSAPIARRVSPNGRLNHVTFGGGGFADSDVRALTEDPRVRLHAIVDVDEARAGPMREAYPEALYYRDWRELFEKEAGNFDSCNVTIPDHMHAAIAMTALQHGKHVYCQKPLAHTLYEIRRLTEEAAARPNLVTQLGVQIHSAQQYRQAVRLIQEGTIGPVHTVYSWSTRKQEPREPVPDRSDPVPSALDWNLWLGVAADRPYVDGFYHPGVWRARVDFGLGRLGDFGPHILDPVFTALELTAPTTIHSLGPAPTVDSWPVESEVIYSFPPTPYTAPAGLTFAWFDGNRRPPLQMMTDLGDLTLPSGGSAILGTEGTMLLQHYGDPPRLFPEERFRNVALPDLPDGNHRKEFVDACYGIGQTSTPFGYGGPLTEAIVAGTVAQRFPDQRLRWNAADLRFSNLEEANAYVRRGYRKGWEVPGIS